MANPEALDQPIRLTSTRVRERRKRHWARTALGFAAGLLLVVAASAGVGLLWLRVAAQRALPVLDGEIHAGGIAAPVAVRRDAHGVPHIEAATQEDLFVAQGYVTAQDRLWQMDLYRRNANGELAEILGPSLVAHDKAQRIFGFRATARRIYANLPADDRMRLDAYTRGVNLFMAQHQDALPPEFKLLFYRPEPWSGADSLSIGMMMVDMLDTHWDVKLVRERIAARLHDAKLEADLYPVGSWRDRPPTGEVIDLTQPRPAPPATTDDEEDDRTQAGDGVAPSLAGRKENERMEGQLSMGTRGSVPSGTQLAAEKLGGVGKVEGKRSSGAKALVDSAGFTRGLKPPPPSALSFSAACKATHDSGCTMDPLRPGSFEGGDGPGVGGLRKLLGLPECDGCNPGSNNWVVAGKHTASGKPLLSNDMHLALSEPNIWFMADLSAPGYHVAGVTLPGMPFVIEGHNDHVAWGFTALTADVQDLYVEKLDGNGNYQAIDGSWKPLSIDPEVIHVRGGKDVSLDVESTAHGPLLTPAVTHDSRPIALHWTLYDPTLSSLPLYAINVASNWAEFSTALGAWNWPTQNVAYSDDQGHIAYHAVGKVPLRPAGLMGVPIEDTQHEWQGYIPFDAMPSAFDPPSGFLATANSRVTTEKSPYPLSLEWADPYRAERIYKSLQGRDNLTPRDMLAVQTDVYSEMDQELGHRFAYAIDHAAGTDDRLRKAADLMRSWDGRLTVDSAAASLITQARAALWPLILEPKVGKDAGEYRWAESNFAEEEIIMHGNAAWFPPGYKNWDAVLTEAVKRGMEKGKAPSDVSRWAYGSWHVIDIEHPLAFLLPVVSRIAGTGAQPLSGDTTTVKQVGRAFGPSQRFTMDWSNVDGSTEDIVLGESGNPYSPYFRDQWDDYYRGTTFALPFTPSAVAGQTRHTLRLLP